MSAKKKDDEKKLQQVRMMLDCPYDQELEERDKYLAALQKRLTGSSHQLEIRYSSSKKDTDLTPHVVVHRKKDESMAKKAAVDETGVKQTYRVDFADEDLFEIERLVDEIPEFVEVQPEVEEEDEPEPQFEEVSEEKEELDELPKWEPVVEEKQKQVPEIEGENDLKKTIKKFEPVETAEDTEEEKRKSEKPDERKDLEESNELEGEENNVEIWDEHETDVSSAKQNGSSVWEPINEKKKKRNLKERAEIFKIFASCNHINQETAVLLFDQGIKTVDELKQTSLETLKDIDGISDEQAGYIFHEVNKDSNETADDQEVREEKEVASEASKQKPYRYGAYSLYKKEISIGDDKTRIVHFFSKKPPEDSQPSHLPSGYKVKVNRKTGVPFIKKIR